MRHNIGIQPDYITFGCNRAQFVNTMEQLSHTSAKNWYVDKQNIYATSTLFRIWNLMWCILFRSCNHMKPENTEYGLLKFVERGAQQGFVQSKRDKERCIAWLENIQEHSPKLNDQFFKDVIQGVRSTLETEKGPCFHKTIKEFFTQNENRIDPVFGTDFVQGQMSEHCSILFMEQCCESQQYGKALEEACRILYTMNHGHLDVEQQKILENLICKISTERHLSSRNRCVLKELLKNLYRNAIEREDYHAALTLYEASCKSKSTSMTSSPIIPSQKDFEAFIEIKKKKKDYEGAHQLLDLAQDNNIVLCNRRRGELYLLQSRKEPNCHKALHYQNLAEQHGVKGDLKNALLECHVAKELCDKECKHWLSSDYTKSKELFERALERFIAEDKMPDILWTEDSISSYLQVCQKSNALSRGIATVDKLLSFVCYQLRETTTVGLKERFKRIQKYSPYIQKIIATLKIMRSFDPKDGKYDFIIGYWCDYLQKGESNYENCFDYYIQAVQKDPNNLTFLIAAYHACPSGPNKDKLRSQIERKNLSVLELNLAYEKYKSRFNDNPFSLLTN